jgi:Cu(I)/Ag(I) efflux system protein CusF
MIARLYRPLAMALLPIALIACTKPGTPAAEPSASGPPLGVDLGGSGPVASAGAGEGHALGPQDKSDATQMAHDGAGHVRGTAILNAVDAAAHKVRLTHAPISEIGWPTMTMDFVVAPSVDLSSLRPNRRVNFVMHQDPDGLYEIESITPAGGDQ